jgi:protein-S-isoprenylcysteine O-methyltransferase Ste14
MTHPAVKARLYDLASASPLIIFLIFVIAGLALDIRGELGAHPHSSHVALSVAAKAAGAVFAAVQVVLFIVRKLPIAKMDTWWPRIVAVAGGNSTLMFLMLPAAAPRAWTNIMSAIFLIFGTAGAIVALSWLGRAFSVTPQARALVVSGPYRFMRHPLYLAEQSINFGIMFQYQQPWGLLVLAVSVAAQFPRMHFEELILSRTFPAYCAYAKRTARLVPGVY